MSTSVLGSVVLPGMFAPNGGSTIEECTSCKGRPGGEGRPTIAGWLSLEKVSETSPSVKYEPNRPGPHTWLDNVVISCGLVMPVLG